MVIVEDEDDVDVVVTVVDLFKLPVLLSLPSPFTTAPVDGLAPTDDDDDDDDATVSVGGIVVVLSTMVVAAVAIASTSSSSFSSLE